MKREGDIKELKEDITSTPTAPISGRMTNPQQLVIWSELKYGATAMET